jgi:hypothetical protein
MLKDLCVPTYSIIIFIWHTDCLLINRHLLMCGWASRQEIRLGGRLFFAHNRQRGFLPLALAC